MFKKNSLSFNSKSHFQLSEKQSLKKSFNFYFKHLRFIKIQVQRPHRHFYDFFKLPIYKNPLEHQSYMSRYLRKFQKVLSYVGLAFRSFISTVLAFTTLT